MVQRFQNILRHEGVADRTVRTVTVIAKVEGDGPEIGGCPALKETEIPRPPEQTMKKHDSLRTFAAFDDM
ncbi:hypothetical protein GKA01_08190 [Gluconobacter kanchanaburiensis NBRC 103587]|uniref:Uncharacterized protein n=1 Tax=Gluconobacter kanchanaburiensis NBRC 103587 TaxID=1307948 RepID=A0A511B7I2_9PROT|nr:hypothetical protein AA103587_0543 [Gluconobacter kanchanaburiensis NBRC 103587]GEK95622.1 hypothetical protein GKA01_08190 [Gluconobacter kanchanaburiensis NBRC 103587]